MKEVKLYGWEWDGSGGGQWPYHCWRWETTPECEWLRSQGFYPNGCTDVLPEGMQLTSDGQLEADPWSSIEEV